MTSGMEVRHLNHQATMSPKEGQTSWWVNVFGVGLAHENAEVLSIVAWPPQLRFCGSAPANIVILRTLAKYELKMSTLYTIC